jgi:hypothetical protein
MTIDYEIKKKVIGLHIQGNGRNQIVRILHNQKMRISEATITYLIQNLKLQQPQPQPSQMPQYDSTTDSDSVVQGQSLLL